MTTNVKQSTPLLRSFVRIDVVELSPEQREEFEVRIKTYFDDRARKVLGHGISVELETEDGSIIVRAALYGTFHELLDRRGEFGAELDRVYSSCRMLGHALHLECLVQLDVTMASLLRERVSLGLLECAKIVLDGLNELRHTIHNMSIDQIRVNVDRIYDSLHILNSRLSDPSDWSLVWNGIEPLYLMATKEIDNRRYAFPQDEQLEALGRRIEEISEFDRSRSSNEPRRRVELLPKSRQSVTVDSQV